MKRKQLLTFSHISPCFKNRTISRHKEKLNFPPHWIDKPVYTNPDNELTVRNIQNCLLSRVLVCLRRKAHLSLVHRLLFANAESLQIFESREALEHSLNHEDVGKSLWQVGGSAEGTYKIQAMEADTAPDIV